MIRDNPYFAEIEHDGGLLMTKFSDIKCRLCGQNALEASDRGAYLTRVNPKGETPMVVQCAPSCGDCGGGKDVALLRAIESKEGK
jgi:hypothetical protein